MIEELDLVDENGIPTGERAERKRAHAEGLRHRTAHVWIVRERDGKTEVLLQKRAMGKDSFPGRYDTSSAGHIKAGDEPTESALRELSEELGIRATADELHFAGNFRVDYQKVFYEKLFHDVEIPFVYALFWDGNIEELTLQKEEVECVAWLEINDLHARILRHDQTVCVPLEGLETLIRYLGKKEKREK